MKKLEEYFKITSYTRKFKTRYRIGLFLVFVLIVVLINMCLNKKDRDENVFLKGLNLKLTLKVKVIRPTGNHGYGVILAEVIHSNTPRDYSATYKSEYTFCKIKDNNILFVSDYYVMEVNDIIVVNSEILKYWIYRKGKLISAYNLTNTTDVFLYRDIEKKKYLDFKTYGKYLLPEKQE
ncbi:hypothetical protein H7F33_16240 [Pedobacter sp. PAMC26386]|nr:hypothetical protein H7F33_16240 [Pedobacter sp. PAMC26386]